jgi:hypothetical protein
MASYTKLFRSLVSGTNLARKVIFVIALAMVTITLSTCTKRRPLAEEGKCKLEFKAVTAYERILTMATQYLVSTTEKPSELIDLPKDVSADYVYFLVKLAGRNTPAVLGSYSKLERSFLYVDTNGNGRLSDEKSYNAKITKRSEFNREEYKFGPISIKYHDADERKSETNFFATTYNGRRLVLYPTGYCVGKIRLGKNTHKVAVIDGSFDGRYDKIFSPPVEGFYRPGCDLFAIDHNPNNFLSREHLEVMPLSRMVRVGSTQYDTVYYNIGITTDGNSLELKKVEPEFGTLDLGGAHVQFQLWSDAARQMLSSRTKTNWKLPAGRYTASPIEFRHIDASGNRWIFRSSRDVGKLKDFEIKPSRMTSFQFGPPFLIKTSVEQIDRNALIGFDLEGQAGVLYRPGARKNRMTIPAPKFEIIDEAGQIVSSGQFEYG